MKTSEVLTKAAEIMIERGHGKGRYVDDDGRVCALGALNCALYGAPQWSIEHDDELGHAAVYVEQVVNHGSLPVWNDHGATTEAMVLSAFHEAALLAKELGD